MQISRDIMKTVQLPQWVFNVNLKQGLIYFLVLGVYNLCSLAALELDNSKTRLIGMRSQRAEKRTNKIILR